MNRKIKERYRKCNYARLAMWGFLLFLLVMWTHLFILSL